jgi:hypothetical protein
LNVNFNLKQIEWEFIIKSPKPGHSKRLGGLKRGRKYSFNS